MYKICQNLIEASLNIVILENAIGPGQEWQEILKSSITPDHFPLSSLQFYEQYTLNQIISKS